MGSQVQEKPTAAYIISLIGGIIGVIIGFILVLAAVSMYDHYLQEIRMTYGVFGFWALICGIIVIIAAINLNSHPMEHKKWGVIILIFSIIGLCSLFGLVGGILALVYKPQAFTPEQSIAWMQQGSPLAITRICPQCGRVLSEEVRFCPYCGKDFGEHTVRTSQMRICSECGRVLTQDAKFCPYCGKQLE